MDLPLTLSASAFSDADEATDPDAEFHQASQWQITTDKGNYTNPAELYTYTTGALAGYTIPDSLTVSTPCWWHVQYQDSSGDWSGYSTDASFTTADNFTPVQPVNQFPGNGTGEVSRSPILIADSYFDLNSSPAPENAIWQNNPLGSGYR